MRDDNKQLDGITPLSWSTAKRMASNVTVPDTHADSHINKTAAKPGTAADKTAENKTDKYARLASTHIFYPFAIKTTGLWHDMVTELTQEIDRRIITITQQRSCSNTCPWQFKEEMRSPSTTT